MRKLTISLAAAALALGGGTYAIAQADSPAKRGPDANGDGIVTKAEMEAGTARMFEKMDANGDGVINADDRAARKAARFARLDADGDGEVTQAEMDAHRAERQAMRKQRHEQMFAKLDTDNSGGISAEEMAAGREQWHERRGKRGDGDRMGRHGKGHRGMGHMMLKMADADGDKSVTKAEFEAAAASHFAKVDTDGDGQITQAERQAAHEKMREMHQQRRDNRPQG
jgi:Ca2+-binding EF-hand superfamily protein